MRNTMLGMAVVLWSGAALAGDQWPQFRGPAGNGHSEARGVPLEWSASENVAWKTAIHGRGWSSPVVWDRHVWMTTATEDGRELFAVCVDRESGRMVHDVKVFGVERPERIAGVNSYASPTPVIEAGRVYVHYGTYGTACLDTQTGRTVWARRDLTCHHHMGPGSSPILSDRLLVFHVDATDVQYVVALDKTTGKTVWKTDRSVDYDGVHPFCRKGFCTPTVIRAGDRLEMISPGSKAVMAYDPNSGKELWKVCYGGWSMTPRPLFGHGRVLVITDYDHPELWAIRPGGDGDVTDTRVAWKIRKGMPNASSLLLIGELIYTVNADGVVSCVEEPTGRVVWQERIGGSFWASPVYVDGRIYLFSQESVTTVIEPGRRFERLAVNRLDGQVMASPAVADGALFLRTDGHLYRIDNGKAEQ
ncbi:MAG: outer membrane protein assembly factor BamB family protein [Planctomycetota bacterium]|jgi:outer membrane protein assembly factor BamB